MVAPESVSFVPPQAGTNGLAAGKSTVGVPLDVPSVEPSSPEAARMVTPMVEASSQAELNEVSACCVQEDSGPPQLMETTAGRGFASCTAGGGGAGKTPSGFVP